MIEATRGQLRNQDLRTSYFASQHGYYDLDIQILERLAQQHPGQGYAWQAFLIAERARARTLLDQVTATDTHTEASPALLALYEDVQRRLRRMETHDAQTSKAAIERLTVSEHQLHAEILADGTPGDTGNAAHPLTLQALEGALPGPRAALVEYWTGAQASYAWSVTSNGIRSVRLPPAAQVSRQCASFRKALLAGVSSDPRLTAEQRAAGQSAQQAELRQLSAELEHILLPPGLLHPATSTVFIIGDGAIDSVPFAALRKGTFLNEPSATIFSVLETNPVIPHPMRLAVFAADSSSASAPHSAQLPALPFAGDEARMIRATMGNDATHLFSGSAISRASLQNLNWNDFSIGHFAMHAVLNEHYAELSGLTLGSEPASHGDSANFLWYGDVCHLRARLDLVVLSACDSARGEQVAGEGLRGLTQAFFAAGSQRVVGTLWPVDDQATSEWMRHFYGWLKKTRSPARALEEAQKTMAADPQWSAPYYWAGFVLAGDWRPLP
jgi:CHAT domain-containing protein